MKRQRLKGKFVRTCAACQTQGDKYTFYRIARVNGSVVADPSCSEMGRGVYVCRDATCIERLRKSRRVDAVLKVSTHDEIYDALLRAVSEEEKDQHA